MLRNNNYFKNYTLMFVLVSNKNLQHCLTDLCDIRTNITCECFDESVKSDLKKITTISCKPSLFLYTNINVQI